MQSVTSRVEFRDVAKGLWIWRAEHHHWKPGDDWQPIVTSTFVESGDERLVLDPLVPKTGADELWKRLDSRPPTVAAVLIPDHVRDVDEFVRRYRVRPFGPRLFWPDDVPKTQLEIIEPDKVLPGGPCRTIRRKRATRDTALAAGAAGDSLWRRADGEGWQAPGLGFAVA